MIAFWAIALIPVGVAAGPTPATAEAVAGYLVVKDCERLLKTVQGWESLSPRERGKLVDLLTPHLGDNTHIGLTDPADTIIPYRLDTGDRKFQGHGLCVTHDLYTTGGRAAYAVGRLIGVDLPEVNEGLPKEERDRRVAAIRRAVDGYAEVVGYLTESDYPPLAARLAAWQSRPTSERVRLAELLAAHLGSSEYHGLTNHLGHVKIGYRIDTGDMPRGDFKRSTNHDLYITCGKAAFAVEELIQPGGRTLPEITAGQTQEMRDRQAAVIRLCVATYKSGASQAASPTK